MPVNAVVPTLSTQTRRRRAMVRHPGSVSVLASLLHWHLLQITTPMLTDIPMDTPTELSLLELVHQLVQQTLLHNHPHKTYVYFLHKLHHFVPFIDVLWSQIHAGHS